MPELYVRVCFEDFDRVLGPGESQMFGRVPIEDTVALEPFDSGISREAVEVYNDGSYCWVTNPSRSGKVIRVRWTGTTADLSPEDPALNLPRHGTIEVFTSDVEFPSRFIEVEPGVEPAPGAAPTPAPRHAAGDDPGETAGAVPLTEDQRRVLALLYWQYLIETVDPARLRGRTPRNEDQDTVDRCLGVRKTNRTVWRYTKFLKGQDEAGEQIPGAPVHVDPRTPREASADAVRDYVLRNRLVRPEMLDAFEFLPDEFDTPRVREILAERERAAKKKKAEMERRKEQRRRRAEAKAAQERANEAVRDFVKAPPRHLR